MHRVRLGRGVPCSLKGYLVNLGKQIFKVHEPSNRIGNGRIYPQICYS
jgi:hypothetical protein